jgi:hypothetical protein
MANYGPSSAFLLVGGKDISADTFGIEENVEQLVEERRGLGESSDKHTPVGVGKVELQTTPGLYDDRATGQLAALQAQGQTRQIVDYGVAGSAAGADVAMVDGTYAMTWKRMGKKDGLTMATANHRLTGSYLRGKVLHGLTSETAASGDTQGATSVDNLASSANGATADIQVPALALGGYTDVTVKVRHSSDDSTYADLITFTNVSAAGASQRSTIGGTVNRHLAMSWLFNGAGSGQSITPFVAVNRG